MYLTYLMLILRPFFLHSLSGSSRGLSNKSRKTSRRKSWIIALATTRPITRIRAFRTRVHWSATGRTPCNNLLWRTLSHLLRRRTRTTTSTVSRLPQTTRATSTTSRSIICSKIWKVRRVPKARPDPTPSTKMTRSARSWLTESVCASSPTSPRRRLLTWENNLRKIPSALVLSWKSKCRSASTWTDDGGGTHILQRVTRLILLQLFYCFAKASSKPICFYLKARSNNEI